MAASYAGRATHSVISYGDLFEAVPVVKNSEKQEYQHDAWVDTSTSELLLYMFVRSTSVLWSAPVACSYRIPGGIVHDISIDASGTFVASAWQAGQQICGPPKK